MPASRVCVPLHAVVFNQGGASGRAETVDGVRRVGQGRFARGGVRGRGGGMRVLLRAGTCTCGSLWRAGVGWGLGGGGLFSPTRAGEPAGGCGKNAPRTGVLSDEILCLVDDLRTPK